MIKKILIGLDSTPHTESVINHAIELSKTCGAKLTGVTVIHNNKLENVGPVPIGGNYYAKNLREFRISETKQSISEAIGKFEAVCKAENISFNVKQEVGNPLNVMVSYARYHDLIILGMRNSFEYGVVDESKGLLRQLLKAGARPILACTEVFQPIKRALIVYDGSIESAFSMKQFIQSGLWSDVKIRIVIFAGKSGESKQLLDDATAYIKSFGYNPETAVIVKDSKDELLADITGWNADVLVMSDGGHSSLISRFIPDASSYMIKHADRTFFLAQ